MVEFLADNAVPLIETAIKNQETAAQA